MKFTAEQIAYLERVIEMEGLRLVIIQDEVVDNYGNVWRDVGGDVRDSFLGSSQRCKCS